MALPQDNVGQETQAQAVLLFDDSVFLLLAQRHRISKLRLVGQPATDPTDQRSNTFLHNSRCDMGPAYPWRASYNTRNVDGNQPLQGTLMASETTAVTHLLGGPTQ